MKRTLRIGHIGLLGTSPLLAANEEGWLGADGLSVELGRELGLATLLEHLAEGRIQAAHLPPHLALLATCGAGVPQSRLTIVAISSHQGMACVIRADRPVGPGLRIAIPGPASSARYLWSLLRGRKPTIPENTTLVPASTSQILDFFADGVVDGIFAPDPLPAFAAHLLPVQLIATSAELAPMHPGACLVVSKTFGAAEPLMVDSLREAILRAKTVCANPDRSERLLRRLCEQGPFETGAAARAAANMVGQAKDTVMNLMSTRFDGPTHPTSLHQAQAYLFSTCKAACPPGMKLPDLRPALTNLTGQEVLSKVTS